MRHGLQVAADDFVAIFDLLALTKEATIAHELSNLLGALFAHPKIVKLGFGLQPLGTKFCCGAVC